MAFQRSYGVYKDTVRFSTERNVQYSTEHSILVFITFFFCKDPPAKRLFLADWVFFILLFELYFHKKTKSPINTKRCHSAHIVTNQIKYIKKTGTFFCFFFSNHEKTSKGNVKPTATFVFSFEKKYKQMTKNV